MSILSRVLAGFIFVASLVFFYSAARTLQTHESWRQKATALESQLNQTLASNELLAHGDQNTPGILQLSVDLHDLIVDRGRVWYGAMPGPIDDTGGTSVTIAEPVPHGVTGNSLLYVFEQSTTDPERFGTYLGAFKVAGVTEADPTQEGQAGEVALVPARALSPTALDRLKASTGPWMLYEILQRDRYDVFADLEEAELQAILPGSTVQDYIKHGEPAEAADPAERKDEEGNYVRQLRDYAVLFRELDRQMTLLRDRIASSESALAALKYANDDSMKQEEFRRAEVATLTERLNRARHELKAVQDLQQKLEDELQRTQDAVAKFTAEARALETELTERQLSAAEAINDRTQATAEPPSY